MIIYVDVLVFLNTLVTYFLLLTVCSVFKTRPKIYRLILGSLFGGVTALVIFLPSVPFLGDILIKAFICFLIIIITFGFKNRIRFAKLCLLFLCVTYIYAGAMLAIYNFLAPTDMAVGNCVAYFDISPFVLICSTVACYLFIKLIYYFKKKSKSEDIIYECRVKFNEKSCSFLAVNDTGNSLCDPYFGDPVAVVSKKALTAVLAENPKLYLIPINCVNSDGFLYAFRPTEFFIIINRKNIPIKNITIALSENNIHTQFDGLLSPLITNSTEAELCEV